MKRVNPAPFGLSGFVLTTRLLSMINAGWYSPPSMPLVLAMAFAFGGTAQFAAGLCELPRGNSFGFVAFCGFGLFWWSFALSVMFPHASMSAGFVGGIWPSGACSPSSCGSARSPLTVLFI